MKGFFPESWGQKHGCALSMGVHDTQQTTVSQFGWYVKAPHLLAIVMDTGPPRFIVLRCIVLHRYCVLCRLKVCDTPVLFSISILVLAFLPKLSN